MPTIHVSSKRQITIPNDLAKQVGIGPHDDVWVEVIGDSLRVRKAPDHPADYFAGRLAHLFPDPHQVDEWLTKERDAWTRG